MDWFSFLNGFVCLAATTAYLCSGILFGRIPMIMYEKADELACSAIKESTLFSILYFTVITIVDMYYGYYDGFILPVSLIALMVLTFLLVSFARQNDGVFTEDFYPLLFILFQVVLLIKLSHTTYFFIDNRINYKLPTSEMKDRVLTASLILELLQVLFWTLIPFLCYSTSKRHITLWSYEYADLISHIIGIVLYLKQSNISYWNITIKAYYAFYIINLFLWVIPLTLVCYRSKSNKLLPAIHCIIIDVITDIPMFLITIVKRTYVNNIYICFGIVIKFIVFVRSVIWIPCHLLHDQSAKYNRPNFMIACSNNRIR
ncbi:hypothetical protein I4U23_022297 [Adineta vaga]|nr:hypothetical protein I4U23_022297 [Adineta vaga]